MSRTQQEIEQLAEQFVFTAQLEGDEAETAKLSFMDGYNAGVSQFKETLKTKLVQEWHKKNGIDIYDLIDEL